MCVSRNVQGVLLGEWLFTGKSASTWLNVRLQDYDIGCVHVVGWFLESVVGVSTTCVPINFSR